MLSIVLLAVSGHNPVTASSAPECQLTTNNVPVNYNGPDIIECICSPEELEYIGNLNFLKQAVGQAARNQRNLEISLGHCETLELELNSAEITYKQFDIKIHNTSSLVINQIRNFNTSTKNVTWKKTKVKIIKKIAKENVSEL